LQQLVARMSQQSTNERMQVRLTTNKFSIISCGVQQPELLQTICKQFDTPILHVQDAQFTVSANNVAFLGQFLQFRDILTCNTLITATDLDKITHKDLIRCHGSGQFVAASAQICAKGAQVSFSVEDSLGNTVAKATLSPQAAPMLSPSSSSTSSSQPSGPQPSVGTSSVSFVGGTRVVHPAPQPGIVPSPSIAPMGS
jgi:hypothetical protein